MKKVAAALVLAGLAAPFPGCGQSPPGRFVVVVVLDTVRRDALGCYGNPDRATPAIDRLAGDGVRFERAIATSSWTLPSVASLLTATWPTIHGAVGRGDTLSPVRPEVATVAEAMRIAGYHTAAFSNAALAGPPFGLDRGFDRFDHVDALGEDPARADETADAAISYARAHRAEDCFIVVHLYDPHLDYDPPGGYDTRFTGGRNQPPPPLSRDDCLDMGVGANDPPVAADIDYVRGVYLGDVAFVDEQVGRMVDELKALGVYDRAMVVVTSDHGEEFWDHGGFAHGHTLYDELVRVPLVIKFPADVHPARPVVTWQVSLIDVMPTVLDYLAIEAPTSFDGESLMSFARAEPRGHRGALSEGLRYGNRRIAWRTSGYVYIQDVEEGRDGTGELFDRTADPGELHDLSADQPEIAAQIRDECMAFHNALLERARAMSALETVDVSPGRTGR